MSAAGASWYSGTGMPPRHCVADIAQYRRGQLLPMIARLMPRLKPSAAKPQANALTSSATCAHVVVCQMPRSFSRNAGRSGRVCACVRSSCGNVCAPGRCVVSTIVPPLFINALPPDYGLLPNVLGLCQCQVSLNRDAYVALTVFLFVRPRKRAGIALLLCDDSSVSREAGLSSRRQLQNNCQTFDIATHHNDNRDIDQGHAEQDHLGTLADARTIDPGAGRSRQSQVLRRCLRVPQG